MTVEEQNRSRHSSCASEPQLYPWQEDCLRQWFANGGRGMVQAVTGSGKTLLALTAARRLEKSLGQELRVKIVVPTTALMKQWERALKAFLPEEAGPHGRLIGLRGGGFQSPPDCRYLICVVNSARYELARQILRELREEKAVFLIADECHHYGSGQNRLIFEFFPLIQAYASRYFAMGLSATLPSGETWLFLSPVLGRRIYSYGMAEAAKEQTVCPYDIYHIGLSLQAGEREEYEELTDRMAFTFRALLRACPSLKRMDLKHRMEELRRLCEDKNRRIARQAVLYLTLSYQRKALVCLASDRTPCVCRLTECLGQEEKILIFGERIAQAEEVYRRLQEQYPGRVGRCHSGMGEQANRNALERFRTGEIRILIACKSLDEGIDVPDVSVGIILSGTSARRQRIQRLGRIIRKKEGKPKASLYYLHISETREDECFLPDGAQNSIFELEYRPETGELRHPAYDERAERIITDAEKKLPEETVKEIRRCLRLGAVRSDWLRERKELEEQLRNAASMREKNYWACMKKMAAQPQKTGAPDG